MTSVNANGVDQAMIAQFKSLPANDQLTALGLLLKEISGSIPADAFSSANSTEMTSLIQEIQAQSPDEQVRTLSGFLSTKPESEGEVALDPNPSKALVELLPGHSDPTRPGVEQYKSMDANARLAFWYQLGQHFSSSIPEDATLTKDATEVFEELRSLSPEQQAEFLTRLA